MTYDRAIEALVAHRADMLERLGAELLDVARGSGFQSKWRIAEWQDRLDALDEMLSSEPRARAIVQSAIERIAK